MLQLISPVRSTNYVRLSLFLLLSCVTSTSHAAISNENFDGQGLIVVNSTSQAIGDWTFSMDASDQIATPNFAESGQNLNNDGGGGDRSLLLNNANASIRVFTMESTDGSDFDIASMTFGLTQASTATSVAFEGFRDGVSVVSSESVNLTSSDSSGSVFYSFTATTAGGSYGAITFQSAYDNVDEIRMTANGIAVAEIDDIVASVAIGNTAPSISIDNSTLAFTEGDSATQVDSAATVSDADGNSDWNGGTLSAQVTANSEAGDEISISDTDGDGTAITISGTNILSNGTDIGDLSVSGGTVTGGTALTITFDSDATNGNVQEVLQSIRYRTTSDSPGTGNRTVTLIATDTNAASANDTRTISMEALDNDGSLTAAGGVSEPVGIDTTLDTVGEAIDVFDFTLSDGGSTDSAAMSISQIVVNVSGTASDTTRDQITWRLNGDDATNVTGVYNGGANTLTFSGLSISIANGGSEVYTVNAYYNDNTGITEDQTITLSVDGDTDVTVASTTGTGMGSTSAVTNSTGTTLDVVTTTLTFTTQPVGSVSGSALLTQPVVAAQDAFGNTDVDFTETVTVTEASAGSLTGGSVAASSGVATFSGLAYTATADQQSFTLTANDEDGTGSNLSTVDANAVTSDVVATQLFFSTQPAPLSVNSASATAFTTVPVVSAQDGNNIVDTGYSTGITLAEVNGAGSATMSATGDTDGSGATVTLNPSSGVASFTGMQVTYTASGGSSETFNLQASSGGLSTANSSQFTGLVADNDGSLTSAGGVSEPVGIDTNLDTVGEAIDVLDFTLSDSGTADGLAMTVSQIVVNVSGTSTDTERAQVTWRLNGNDASNITGVYSAGADTITFSSLSLSIADGGSEVYTVNAYYNDNTSITEDATFVLSVDGDTDLTIGGSGTQMGSTSAITNGSGGTFDVVATALAFTTLPADSVSGSALTTQPVVTARDAFGNTDVDFTETVTVTEASAGTLINGSAVASSGVATFSGLAYTATADQQSFTLTANDDDGTGTNLSTVDANAVTSDVIATKLVFDTQPVPLSVLSGSSTSFSTVPVVSAQDANDIVDTGYSTSVTLAEVNGAGSAAMSGTADTDGSGATVTITPSSGVSTFTGIQLTYSNSGTSSETFNLQASSGGLSTANSSQLTGFLAPTITAATYSVSTGVLTVTGTNFIANAGASNDVDVQTLTLTGQGGGTRTLINSSDVEITSATEFSVTISGADKAAVDALLNQNGTSSSDSTTYNLAAADDFISAITGGNSADLVANGITVSGADLVAPRVTSIVRQSPTTSPTNADSLSWDVAFDEGVDNVDAADFSVSGTSATITSVTNTSGNTYRVTASGGDLASLNATVTLSFAGGQNVADSAGNALTNTTPTGANDNTFVLDNTGPGVTSITRQSPTAATTNADTLTWDVTFDGAVSNVGAADFTVSGTTATITSVTNPSGNTYRVTASGGDLASFNGTVTLGFAGGQDITDDVDNALTDTTPSGTNDNTFVLDNAGPGVTSITRQSPTTSPTNADTLIWDVTFDDAVANVSAADFSVSGTTATVTSVTNPSGNVYRVTVSGGDLASLSATVSLAFAGAQDIADAIGNALINTTPAGINDNTFEVDNVAPSVSIASPSTDNTNNGPVTFTLTYSGADTIILSETDITLDSTEDATGTVAVSGTGNTTRTVTISDITGNGSLGISVGSATASDTGGNDALAPDPSETFRVDNIAPTIEAVVAENVNLDSSATSYDAAVTYTDATFNEMDFGSMGVADITVTGPGGTLTVASVDAPSVSPGADQNATYTITPPDGAWSADDNGTYTIALNDSQVSDAAGNFVEANTEIATFEVDVVAPTLAITLDDTDLVDGETATVSFTFSETPVDFIEDDISTIENGILSDFAVDGDDDTLYTATFTPTAELSDATNIISVLGSSYTDALGNAGEDASSANYAITSTSADALAEVTSAADVSDASAVTIDDLNDITGVSGATEANAEAYRAAIEAADAENLDSAEEIQALVDTVNTQEAAIQLVEDSTGDANTVTAEQLNAITGVSGAVEENEDAYQAAIENSAQEDLDTPEEIQAMVTQVNAIRVVETAAGAANTLTTAELNDIEGVDAAIEANESDYQAAIEIATAADIDTAEEIQALLVSVNAQNSVEAAAESSDASGVTADDLNSIAGVSSASLENESSYQAAIAAANPEEVDSAEEIQAIVNTVNAQRVIASTAGNSGTTEPTLEDYLAAGIDGVSEQTLVLLNTAVAQQTSSTDVDETSEIEALLATIMEGQDVDGDGLPSILEGDGDTDGDGIADRDDIDSDNDGVSDLLETRLNQEDSDNDGIIDVLDADVVDASLVLAKVGEGIPSQNFAKGDGIVDEGKADENLDGVDDNVDTFAELIMVLIDTDFDGDTKPNHLDLDSDNDGLLDIEEAGLSDNDENGLLDDGDTVITDADDLPNTDDDEQPNFVDLTSDGSSNDLQIQSLDTDSDGVLDSTIDMDNDGVIDTVDGAVGAFGSLPDADGDGIANAFDDDDDNDGIPDTEENPRQAAFTGLDADADGIDDGVDAEVNGVLFGTDADENGVQDTLELADFDNDGIADHLDADSDNDGTSDDEDLVVSLGPDVKESSAGAGAMSLAIIFGLAFAALLRSMVRSRRILSKTLAVVVGLLVSMFTRAEVGSWQAGAALGISTIDPELSSSLSVTDDKDTSLQLSVAFSFADRWLAEARYIDFGEATVNDAATVEFDALALNVQYHWSAFKDKPITLYVLGGFANISSSSDQLSLESDSSTDLTLGFGATYQMDKWQLFSEFTSYNSDLSNFLFGVKRSF